MSYINNLNPAVLSDSYKASHYLMYPDAEEMIVYGGYRKPYEGMDDNRFVFYGIDYIRENYLEKRWTKEDVVKAKHFYSTYNVAFSEHPFPEDLFNNIVDENDGWFPVKIETLPEGSVGYVGTPVYQMVAKGKYSRLVTWLETIMTMLWYPSNVATLSRLSKDIIMEAFDKSVDPEMFWLLNSRLHDFGFRGCASVEQSIIGGSAHGLNFGGSDTMSAAYYIQYHRNGGKPVFTSIPATEHSVMMAHRKEQDAFKHVINTFGHSLVATVMDTNDLDNACDNIIPLVANDVKTKGGLHVLRPDSGDPVLTVLKCLESAEKAYGSTVNKKGFRVLNNSAVIQGDGINQHTIRAILKATIEAGFSAQNVAFGMGAGLLQKHNRDTMSFASKLSYIKYADGSEKDVMKAPKTDSSKCSLPGKIDVCYDSDGILKTYPEDVARKLGLKSAFVTVYDNGPVKGTSELFDTLIERVNTEWKKTPNGGLAYSQEMQDKINATLAKLREPCL